MSEEVEYDETYQFIPRPSFLSELKRSRVYQEEQHIKRPRADPVTEPVAPVAEPVAPVVPRVAPRVFYYSSQVAPVAAPPVSEPPVAAAPPVAPVSEPRVLKYSSRVTPSPKFIERKEIVKNKLARSKYFNRYIVQVPREDIAESDLTSASLSNKKPFIIVMVPTCVHCKSPVKPKDSLVAFECGHIAAMSHIKEGSYCPLCNKPESTTFSTMSDFAATCTSLFGAQRIPNLIDFIRPEKLAEWQEKISQERINSIKQMRIQQTRTMKKATPTEEFAAPAVEEPQKEEEEPVEVPKWMTRTPDAKLEHPSRSWVQSQLQILNQVLGKYRGFFTIKIKGSKDYKYNIVATFDILSASETVIVLPFDTTNPQQGFCITTSSSGKIDMILFVAPTFLKDETFTSLVLFHNLHSALDGLSIEGDAMDPRSFDCKNAKSFFGNLLLTKDCVSLNYNTATLRVVPSEKQVKVALDLEKILKNVDSVYPPRNRNKLIPLNNVDGLIERLDKLSKRIEQFNGEDPSQSYKFYEKIADRLYDSKVTLYWYTSFAQCHFIVPMEFILVLVRKGVIQSIYFGKNKSRRTLYECVLQDEILPKRLGSFFQDVQTAPEYDGRLTEPMGYISETTQAELVPFLAKFFGDKASSELLLLALEKQTLGKSLPFTFSSIVGTKASSVHGYIHDNYYKYATNIVDLRTLEPVSKDAVKSSRE